MSLPSLAKDLFTSLKTGTPIPHLINSTIDAETLWPADLQNEADKAATILRSFFFDGFVVPYRTLGVCQQDIVRKCSGLAIFHLLRNGLASSAASGSGVLIARLPDGKWSGAAAILVDSKSPFPQGVDVLDVVLIINDKRGMDALLEPVVSLEKSLSVSPGPTPRSDQAPLSKAPDVSIWTYAKSKGELVDIDLSGLIIRDAEEENARCYGVNGVSRREILSGQVSTPAGMSGYLHNSLKAIDQRDGDLSGLPKAGKCPGDRRVRAPSHQ